MVLLFRGLRVEGLGDIFIICNVSITWSFQEDEISRDFCSEGLGFGVWGLGFRALLRARPRLDHRAAAGRRHAPEAPPAHPGALEERQF